MVATVAGIHLGIDTHVNRPAGNSCPDGSLFSCSTHGLIYKSNFVGNSWATWATLGGVPSGSITASGYTQNTARLLGRTTAAAGAIEEITVGSGLSLSAGSLTATGVGGGIVAFATTGKVTTGNKTLSSTTWANLDTAMDLVVSAAIGDLIEITLNGFYENQNSLAVMDCMTLVSAVGVSWFGSGEPTTGTGDGIGSWISPQAAAYTGIGASAHHVVVSGDISAGTVTLRLRYRVATTSIVLRANSIDPLMFTAKVFRV